MTEIYPDYPCQHLLFMYGKIFESMYQGSMVGAGANVFALWPYVIANMRKDPKVGAQVDLNPKVLAFVFGNTEGDVRKAIEYLCSPDAHSTSKTEAGRRLIRMGEFAYRVVNGAAYMGMRSSDERREYQREKQAEYRAKKKNQSMREEVNKAVAVDPITKADRKSVKGLKGKAPAAATVSPPAPEPEPLDYSPADPRDPEGPPEEEQGPFEEDPR